MSLPTEHRSTTQMLTLILKHQSPSESHQVEAKLVTGFIRVGVPLPNYAEHSVVYILMFIADKSALFVLINYLSYTLNTSFRDATDAVSLTTFSLLLKIVIYYITL